MARIRVHGFEVDRLDSRTLTRDNLFAVGFDGVLADLARLSRVDAELDGFFVRTGEDDTLTWKLNGHLFELNERLWRVDLHGECPRYALDEVLTPLGWPAVPLVFQWVRLGVTVAETDFRRLAAR